MTPWTAAYQASLSVTVSQSLLKLMFIESIMPLTRSLSTHSHSTNSFSVVPFSSCLQSSPASGSFQMSQLFTSGGQSIGDSASASVLPMNNQGWFSLGWSPGCPGDSQESAPAAQFKGIGSLPLSLSYCPALTSVHDYWKNHSFDNTDLFGKAMCLFNMLSGLVIAFLPRRKHLLISWLQSPSYQLVISLNVRRI